MCFSVPLDLLNDLSYEKDSQNPFYLKMEEFNRFRKYPETLKLKDFKLGKYNLLLLRQINTKFDYCVIAKF